MKKLISLITLILITACQNQNCKKDTKQLVSYSIRENDSVKFKTVVISSEVERKKIIDLLKQNENAKPNTNIMIISIKRLF